MKKSNIGYISNISIIILILILKKFSLLEFFLKFDLFVVIFSFIIVCIYYKFFILNCNNIKNKFFILLNIIFNNLFFLGIIKLFKIVAPSMVGLDLSILLSLPALIILKPHPDFFTGVLYLTFYSVLGVSLCLIIVLSSITTIFSINTNKFRFNNKLCIIFFIPIYFNIFNGVNILKDNYKNINIYILFSIGIIIFTIIEIIKNKIKK